MRSQHDVTCPGVKLGLSSLFVVRQNMFGFVGKTFSDFQQSARSVFELTQDSMAASGAVQMSNRARATVLDQWEKLTNVATERDSIERLA